MDCRPRRLTIRPLEIFARSGPAATGASNCINNGSADQTLDPQGHLGAQTEERECVWEGRGREVAIKREERRKKEEERRRESKKIERSKSAEEEKRNERWGVEGR